MISHALTALRAMTAKFYEHTCYNTRGVKVVKLNKSRNPFELNVGLTYNDPILLWRRMNIHLTRSTRPGIITHTLMVIY